MYTRQLFWHSKERLKDEWIMGKGERTSIVSRDMIIVVVRILLTPVGTGRPEEAWSR